jgi:predicted dehydrogenase
MSQQQCRWGILGAANIARKNWRSIRNAGNASLTAVASRDRERAARFIAECQSDIAFPTVPHACRDYAMLLERDDVDAVYIPLPTGLRKEWVIRAADAGKHVMCEKPCAISVADLRQMLDACRRNNVQFMDGVMFMHSRRLDALRAVLDDGESIGPIRRITSQFSFRAPEEFVRGNIRVSSELEPAGCLGDLGWYNIRFALWTMNYQLPRQVTGRLLARHGREDSPQPVPTEFSGELQYDGGVSAGFYCSFLARHQQWAHVSGESGHLTVPDFVLPVYGNEAAFTVERAQFAGLGTQFNMESHPRRIAVAEYSNSHPDAQETNLFRNFSALVLAGKPDPVWGEIALKTQQVLDACLQSALNGSQPVPLP